MSDSASVPTSTEAQASLVVDVSDFPLRVDLPLSVGPRRPLVAPWDPASPSDPLASPSDPLASPSDITNYAYVWYKTDPAQLSQFSKDELDKIHIIIMNYSYPCYLAGHDLVRLLPDNQKIKLLNSELIFIREKMTEVNLGHIVIIQIPRILYDLFNIYYTSTDHYFTYTCSFSLRTLDQFNKVTRRNTEYCKQSIFTLNNHIINYLNANNYLDNIESHYDAILDFLTLPREPRTLGLRRVHDVITYSILTSNNNITYNNFLQRLRLLGATLDFEKQKSEGRFTLYRAATLRLDNVGTQTLSLNTSMLTGCVSDNNGACTFTLCLQGGETPLNTGQFFYHEKKIKYNIKKFLVGDLSPEDSLFFIPPIHPFLQIYCGGELFHARTKFGQPFSQSLRTIGIACGITDYLKSTKTTEELQRIYEGYKDRDEIFVWYLSNERRPVIGPALPPPIPQPPALTFAQRFQALFTRAPSQTLPQQQRADEEQRQKSTDWYGLGNPARQGGGRRKNKKKYFSKQHHSLRRNKSRRNKSRRKNKSRRN